MVEIGKTYNTNNCGKVKVLRKLKGNNSFEVEFIDTGTIKTTRGFQIEEGCLRDPYARIRCGVACTGNVSTKRENAKFHSVWHDMINRCYNPNDKRAEAYKDVTVCDRWLVFENFLKDAPKIEGFNEQKFESGELVLDKDIKQRWAEYKIYSPETCVWTTKEENNTIQDAQQRKFYALSPEGELFEDYNITAFAKKHHLSRRHISGCLHGRAKTTGNGWKFSYEEIV